MFGFTYHRSLPTRYLMLYRNGRVVKQGAGLALMYNRFWESVVEIPLESKEVPFIFGERTRDFQDVSIEGHYTYQVNDPALIAGQLDFTIRGDAYVTDDWMKLPERVLHIVQEKLRFRIAAMTLEEAMRSAAGLGPVILDLLRGDEEIERLGLDMLSLRIGAIKASPETARALEAGEREKILQDADEAIYRRRNAAVEQERLIKENELNTELAVRDKEHQLLEKELRAREEELDAKSRMERSKKDNDLAVEHTQQKLVALRAKGTELTGKAEAEKIAGLMRAYNEIDPALMEAVKYSGMNPVQILADGFRELAKNKGAIGQLNVSPDLVQALSAVGDSLR